MPKKISELIEPYQTMAIHRRSQSKHYIPNHEWNFLSNAIIWGDTPEGYLFWESVAYAVTESDYPPLPTNTSDITSPTPTSPYDLINPVYYRTTSVEVIDMMIKIWGKDAVIDHCEMCAFKYRMRLGNKPNNSVDDDLGKAKWYESKANELKTK